MKNSRKPTERWYEVVYLTIEEEFDEDGEEASYYDYCEKIALSKNLSDVTAIADALNRDHNFSYDAKTVSDVLNNYELYAGSGLYVVDKCDYTEEQIAIFEARGKVIGHPNFKLIDPLLSSW